MTSERGRWMTKPVPDPTQRFIRIKDATGIPGTILVNARLLSAFKEYCPHEWGHLDTAKADVPPCWLTMAGKRKGPSCPSDENVPCGSYARARLSADTKGNAMRWLRESEGFEQIVSRVGLPVQS